MLTTLTPPTSGTARVGGYDVVREADAVRHTLGVIPQAFTSDPELTAEENMLIHAKLYGVPSGNARQLIDRLLESVDLAKFQIETGAHFFRRDAAAAGNCARAGAFAQDSVSRRADDGPRSCFAHKRVGNDPATARRISSDDSADDALHGRSRQALRPHRHRRSRKAGCARFADATEGQRAGDGHGGSGIRRMRPRIGSNNYSNFRMRRA